MKKHKHFYFYAKGWYKKTDIIEDLKIIQANWAGVLPENVSISDISNLLLGLVYKIINSERAFLAFMGRLYPENRKYSGSENDPFEIVVIKNCVPILRYEIPYDLSLKDLDESILPLSEPAKRDLGYDTK